MLFWDAKLLSDSSEARGAGLNTAPKSSGPCSLPLYSGVWALQAAFSGFPTRATDWVWHMAGPGRSLEAGGREEVITPCLSTLGKLFSYSLFPYLASFFLFHIAPVIVFNCIIGSVSSVTQLCLTLCDPMDHSTPGLPVHHHFLEFTQTHVHWVSDAIQLSHPVVPFSSCPQSLQASGSFPMSQLFPSCGQRTEVSASASVLPMNIQGWYPLR